MTAPIITGVNGMNLQATLAAASSVGEMVAPHHPINCTEDLEVDPDAGEFRCPHAAVALTEERTRAILDHTVAILLLEMAAQR